MEDVADWISGTTFAVVAAHFDVRKISSTRMMSHKTSGAMSRDNGIGYHFGARDLFPPSGKPKPHTNLHTTPNATISLI